MNIVFYIFASILVYLSWNSFRGGLDYLNFFRRELARSENGFTPVAAVIAPCRGAEEGLEENLTAIFNQEYSAYEIIFVVDSSADGSVETIEQVIAANKHLRPAKLVVAGSASGEAQKVHNLREAVLHVSKDAEVLVFVDSDARPSENWLRSLVSRLADEKVGAASSYRWFIPEKGGLASALRSVWNASVASALGPNTATNFCWGGALAIRRETFEKIEMRERWRGTLSDDFAVTRELKSAGYPVVFVPSALTASVGDCSFREMLEFTTRQLKITRVYSPGLWIATLLGSAIFNAVFVWGIYLLFSASSAEPAFWFAAGSLLSVTFLSIGKSHLRLKAVRLAMPGYRGDLRKQFLAQNTLWILTPALFLYNSLCALFSRTIVWRGITYKLKSPKETVIV